MSFVLVEWQERRFLVKTKQNWWLCFFFSPSFVIIGWCTCIYETFLVSLSVFSVQSHIRVLETTPENRSALLMGLEYLIGISYVDDTEVFKVWMWQCTTFFIIVVSLLLIAADYICFVVVYWMGRQVSLDYWNSLVLELFGSHHNLDGPAATASMMGLQVYFNAIPLCQRHFIYWNVLFLCPFWCNLDHNQNLLDAWYQFVGHPNFK